MATIADRTVSVRLRADVTGYIASMRRAEAATRRFGDETENTARRAAVQMELMRGGADRLERQIRRLQEAQRENTEQTRRMNEETRRHTQETQRNTQQQDQNTQSQNRATRATQQNVRGLTAQRSTLVSVIALAGAAGAASVSAAVAMGAFGAVAAPAIYRVVSAQEDLAANWSRLSQQERISAVQVHALADEYKDLAQSYAPQALITFNSLISTARGLLPQVGQLVGETADDVQTFTNRINTFISGRVGGEFLTWAGTKAPQALDALGGTLVTAGDTTLDLVQDLEPLGIGLLQLTTGTLSALNAVAGINPVIAQFAVSALLLRAPVMGLIGGITTLSARLATYTASTAGATLATRALSAAAALSPVLWVAGAAAMLVWASKAGQTRTAAERLTESLQVQHRAVGNNLDGYQLLAADLMPRLENANRRLKKAIDEKNDSDVLAVKLTGDNSSGFQKAAEDVFAYGRKTEEARTAIRNLNTTSKELASTYNISEEAARRLATAAGVDLTKAVDKQGYLTLDAARKIDAYREAAQLARNPTQQLALAMGRAADTTLLMKDRVDALSAAFDSHLNPSLEVFNATTKMREGFRSLAEEIGKAKGRMDGNSEASLRLRNQFGQQIASVRDLANATFAKTQSMDAARRSVQQQLPLLFALAGRNKEAKAQVDALARTFGVSTAQLTFNRGAFIQQATAMLGSRAAAERLWATYNRLYGATNRGTAATTSYITRVKEAANQARIQALRTDGAAGAQSTYNARVRAALPVLYALAGNNKNARAQVDALARATGNATGATNISRRAFLRTADSMKISRARAEELWRELNKIKNRTARVSILATGTWRSASWAQTGGPAHVVPRATGGPIPAVGPESSRAYDSVPALLRVDEHVWTPEEVDAVGGHGAMYRLRAMAKAGALRGFKGGGNVQRFATGGRVAMDRSGSTRAVVDDVMDPIDRGYNSMMTAMMRHMAEQWRKYMASGGRALAWARSQVGKPYVWGGVGPGGYDCSGWTSAITNVIQGRNPHSRRHTTHSFGASSGPDGFVRGRQSPFMVGVTDAGVGHMAGTLGGFAVESSGSAGVRVGGGARGANNPLFTRQYGLRMAQGGAVTDEEARLARQALRPGASRREVDLAASLGLTGDPSSDVSPVRPRVPAFGAGGWVTGKPGKDRNLIAATAGEFVVNRDDAGQHAALVQAINSGQVGRALIAPTISAPRMRPAGGDGASAGPPRVVVEFHNHGVIGSRLEVQDMLVGACEDLERQGRAPWRKATR